MYLVVFFIIIESEGKIMFIRLHFIGRDLHHKDLLLSLQQNFSWLDSVCAKAER